MTCCLEFGDFFDQLIHDNSSISSNSPVRRSQQQTDSQRDKSVENQIKSKQKIQNVKSRQRRQKNHRSAEETQHPIDSDHPAKHRAERIAPNGRNTEFDAVEQK